MSKLSAFIKWVAGIILLFLIFLTLFRIFFYFHYRPSAYVFPVDAFLMGLRMDLRTVSILGLTILMLCAFRAFNPFKNKKAGRFWNTFLAFLFLVTLLFYIVDFYHFDYLHQRLNASVLNYLQDAGISLKMVSQSYPLFSIIIVVAVLTFLLKFIFSGWLSYIKKTTLGAASSWLPLTILVIILLGGTWGTISQFPLRWSNVFTLGDPFKSQLALNPFQSFFSTLSFKNSTYDLKSVKKYYPLMADYLGVQHPDSLYLNFQREYKPLKITGGQRNVVLVICESFSAYKSSMWGNPLHTTPFFDSMCRNGVFFDRCFTPSYGTARGVWATVTGIPDVEYPSTSSRNPKIVDQNTIINDFKGYEKFYFIGGNANWANIRGLLKNNIQGLRLYEQQDYPESQIDVWGVSDKNLFLESVKILSKQQKPFFAVIQTADNHRPYTIPSEDRNEFKKISVPADTLKKYGFISNEELNAFRYTDFSYGKFMHAAMASPWFQNTLFVFVGDHGIRGDAGDMFPAAWTAQALTTVHVPLLFFGPSIVSYSRLHNICSQLDILPSIAGLLSIPFVNTAMGRNLFDSHAGADPFRYSSAFIIDPDEKKIGMVSDDYYLRKMMNRGTIELVSVKDNEKIPAGKLYDSIENKLSTLADAYYATAKYLLYHNNRH